jgi:hypothetical protein
LAEKLIAEAAARHDHEMTRDRRARRSAVRTEALDHLLSACRAGADLEALVLCDERGLVVAASAATHVDTDMIAAALPDPTLVAGCSLVRSVRFAHGQRTLYMGAVGAGPRAFAPLPAAIEGAKRILATM